ncbi:flagellar hook-basal body protein [Tenuibacillus multivorans]|uniref:Flagellar basal-body rod protein FlgG n=1 Tax=Tenuibacillus multivorans TaxID=237069 RepID=A0A1G9X4A1_9BACI|nr:flagellar hook-basal body protein [Tenuibacillus multivorans]GEL77231.1 flagellar hook-basal body complex protein FlhO [Tenuibacillus multivorans]SDM91604.1 flagellar basal-body rod protein FlgG [Tenuibacillus multivorans]
MLRGYYTAGAGMIAQQRYQEALSNNMSNALTPGYKADRSTFRAFPEMLISRMESYDIPTSQGLNLARNQNVGSINTGVYMQEGVPLFQQGDVRETGLSTDLAMINGDLPEETGFLFFTVQNEDGDIRYTRNGNFTVDAEGYLTTSDGHYVLDENNNRIQTGTEEFQVTENGEVISPFDNTMIGVAYHPNANDFVKEGANLFANEGDVAAVDARAEAGVNFQVAQGRLERSNVSPEATMTEMMRSYRLFEINQQVVKTYDQSMDIAANQIGRLR